MSPGAMNEFKPPEFSEFTEEVRNIINNRVDAVIGNSVYFPDDVPNWVDSITSEILDQLQKMSDGFKYICNVVILQRSNTGFHLFSTCFWDQKLDGTVTVQWENRAMHCIVTVFGVAV